MRRIQSSRSVRCLRHSRELAGLRSRAWLGVVALLIQLAVPFLHSLEIQRDFAEGSVRGGAHVAAYELDSGTRTLSARPVAAHDEQSCPICAALSHAHAATAAAARVPAAFDVVAHVVPAASRTAPSSDIASHGARAPPVSSPIAIS